MSKMAASPGDGNPSSVSPVVVLAELYEYSVIGTPPNRRHAEEVARVLVGGVLAERETEVCCLALTLIGRTLAGSRLHRFHRDVAEHLLRHSDVLVARFGSEEQMISHLAAKSASSCVLYQLRQSGTLQPAWRRMCQQVLATSPAGPRLDACLWSLSRVLRRLLRDDSKELVQVLVTAFDASAKAAAARFLGDAHADADCDTLCLLFDLLELLATASTPDDGEGPESAYVRAGALLGAVAGAPRYFVRKRAALLLKRAALRSSGPADLARAALDAVAADWLPSVAVAPTAFFGGTVRARDGGRDATMLRALGLLVIKSVERHVAADDRGAARAAFCLSSLWHFLREKGVRPTSETDHHCAVLPLLFGEQDDDMAEAAKAALAIFLHFRERWQRDPCGAGCNPHCHFLFLLRGLSWDERLLLDFLISAETCFLEYLVRYLRYLRSDRGALAASCRRLDAERPPEDAWRRATGCLLRLRLLIARLQSKKLFPYKADSLLKLLTEATPPAETADEKAPVHYSEKQRSRFSTTVNGEKIKGGHVFPAEGASQCLQTHGQWPKKVTLQNEQKAIDTKPQMDEMNKK
ncbi:protein Lines homolog 1 [Stigmatopora argus]